MLSSLLESNADVNNLLSILDTLVVDLRRSNKLDKETFEELKEFYDIEVSDFLDSYIVKDIEVEAEYEDYISDIILSLIVILREIK